MPSVHKYPPIAYRPPREVRDRLHAHAKQTGRPVSAIITEALREHLPALAEDSTAQAPADP